MGGWVDWLVGRLRSTNRHTDPAAEASTRGSYKKMLELALILITIPLQLAGHVLIDFLLSFSFIQSNFKYWTCAKKKEGEGDKKKERKSRKTPRRRAYILNVLHHDGRDYYKFKRFSRSPG